MTRHLFHLAAVLSILLWMGSVALWAEGKSRERRVGVVISGVRFTAASGARGIGLFRRPPLPKDRKAVAKLARQASQLRDDQISWEACFSRYGSDFMYWIEPDARHGTPADDLELSDPGAVPLLLDALENPDRFVAAHVLLSLTPAIANFQPHTGWPDFTWTREPLDGTGTYDGLPVHLSIPSIPDPPPGIDDRPDRIVEYHATFDRWQMRAIREQWHRRFDVRLISMPYSVPAVLFLIVPLGWLGSLIRRGIRRRHNLCIRCAYNLTANTSGICPECGTPVTTKVRT